MSLVVARYRENLSWLSEVGVKYHVYDKSGSHNEWESLPNIGREGHTYLHHICHHYYALTDWVAFCQGHPFDHSATITTRLSRFAALEHKGLLNGFPNKYISLTDSWALHPFSGHRRFHVLSSRRIPEEYFNLSWAHLATWLGWPVECDHILGWFNYGACFLAHRNAIRMRPLDKWVDLMGKCSEVDRDMGWSAYLLELAWPYLMTEENIGQPKTLADWNEWNKRIDGNSVIGRLKTVLG